MSGPVLALIVAILMEPVSAAVHRFIGHGPAWALHSDHHDPHSRWERNDVIPLAFAGLAMVAFALSVNDPRLWWLFWTAVGVTVFGLTYALIHDVYIHRRIPILPRRIPWLEPLRRAHLEHHRTGVAPYGVIAPIRRAVRRS